MHISIYQAKLRIQICDRRPEERPAVLMAWTSGLASSKTPTRMCREQFTAAGAGWAAEADAARAARAASAFVARLIT